MLVITFSLGHFVSTALPPLNDQQALVVALASGRAEAARLRSEATADRAKAWTEFEAAVYAPEPTTEAAPHPVDYGIHTSRLRHPFHGVARRA